MLHLADTLKLPLELITQKTAILARTGAGKTNAAVVIAEEVLRAKQQVVALDPKGDWHGLRSSADGTRAGYQIIVLGGEHGDVPLEAGGGDVVADLVVDEGVSAVLDVSEFSTAERTRFVTAFAERLYRRKSQRPDPLLLIFEEADEVCPQRFGADQARMVGAIERIVKRGRFKGIGTVLVTQRSASLNKDALTQTEVLIVMQTTGPQDIKAIDAWIEHHPDQAKRAQLLAEVATLKQGEAFLWSPSWLDRFTRFRFRMRTTFDTGRTPKVGERRITPKVLADVDLAVLRDKMAATIERAKADDPRALRAKIAELERQIKAAPKAEVERVEVPVLSEKDRARFKETGEGIMECLDRLSHLFAGDVVAGMHSVESLLRKELLPVLAVVSRQTPATVPTHRPASAGPARPPATLRHQEPTGEGVGGGGLRRMLIALAQRPQGLSATQLGVRAGMSSSSGTFASYLGRARAAGWVSGSRGRLEITVDGVKALGPYDPLPVGRALLDYWLGELGQSGAARMLVAVSTAYPRGLTREAIGEAAGIVHTSGTFANYLGRLRALELVEGKGEIRMSEELA
jgi:hypothetical protein